MVMLAGIVDPEGDDNLVKERDFGKRHPAIPQIGGGVEDKLVPPGGETVTLEKRRIHPPVIIRRH